jgi:predicted GNAT superfamily acetyltransferase
MSEIQIKPLRALDDMRAAVELQRTYWGDDLESVVPAHMLFTIANAGGHVLAAFDGDRMVGVLIGLLGTSTEDTERPAMANLQIVSKRMVVLDQYRSSGIGYRLKLAQRQAAIKQGVRLVTWTFDPLLASNAHLNFRKLGGICHTYLENYYGTSNDGGLSTLGYSDRLLVEWWVTNRRVEERIHGKRGDLTLRQYLDADTPIVNPTTADEHLAQPAETYAMPTSSMVLIEIPINFPLMAREEPALAQDWRLHTRELFQWLLGRGYLVTDFLHELHEGRDRAFYLLSHGTAPNGG